MFPTTRSRIVVEYFGRVWTTRYFWLALVQTDLRTRYHGSVLGIGWSLLNPVLMTSIVCLVFHGLFQLDAWSYAPFLFIGMTFWTFVTSSVGQGCLCFHLGSTYIHQQRVPLAVYPLRTVLSGGLHLAVAMALAVPAAAWFRGNPLDLAVLSLPLTFALLMVLGWSLCVLAGVANVYFPDVEHLSAIVLQLVFYTTPILYPPEVLRTRGLGWLCDYNPLAAFLEMFRQPMLEGHLPSPATVGVAVGATLLLTCCAMFALARSESRLIFRL